MRFCKGAANLGSFFLLTLLILALSPTARAARYTMMVTTGDLKDASTKATIKISLHGRLENHSFELKQGMKRKDTYCTKLMIGKKLGKLRSILVEHDNSGESPNWFLTRVNIFESDGRKKRSYYFPCERWLSKSDDDKQIKRLLYPVESLSRYQVDIYTGKEKNASTNARVRLALKGTGKLALRPYQLDGPGTHFQAGQIDRFTVYTYYLGNLEKLALHQDNSGVSPDWYVEKVFISCLETDEQWLFPVKKWLEGKNRQCTVKPFIKKNSTPLKKERSEAK